MTNKEISEVKNNLPSVQYSAKGFEEDYDREDIIIPRVQLVQKMSPVLDEGIDGVKFGSIINSLTKEPLGETFIPIFMFYNWIRYNSKSANDEDFDPSYAPGELIWRSNDPRDPRVVEERKWRGNKKPLATQFMNFFSLFDGSNMPVIISFSKTSYKSGRQLFSLAKFSGGDMFSRKYKLYSKIEQNETASYAVLKVAPFEKVTEDEYNICDKYWHEFSRKQKDIQIHEESNDDELDTPF